MFEDICPNCEKITHPKSIQRQDTINVRGELIEVEDQFLRCSECGEEFEDPKSDYDVLAIAYQKYRKKHGMLQPEDIRDWRKKYNLTQRELSSLLSWGGATLSRYEQGGLQDDAHEKMLRLIMDPYNFLNLIRDNNAVLPREKKEELIKVLTIEKAKEFSGQHILNNKSGDYTTGQDSENKQSRSELYRVVDQVIKNGTPVEVMRNGHKIKIILVKGPKLDRLVSRKGIINGDPDSIVHCVWLSEKTEIKGYDGTKREQKK